MNQMESITMNEPNAMHINNDDQQLFVCIVVDLLLLDFVCVVQHDSPRKCTACVCVCVDCHPTITTTPFPQSITFVGL